MAAKSEDGSEHLPALAFSARDVLGAGTGFPLQRRRARSNRLLASPCTRQTCTRSSRGYVGDGWAHVECGTPKWRSNLVGRSTADDRSLWVGGRSIFHMVV